MGFGAYTELQVPFLVHLPLLCSVASMSPSAGAAETSVHCVATLVSYHSSLRCVKAGLCLGAVLSTLGSSCDFLAPHLHPLFSPALLLWSYFFNSLLWCVFSDGTGIIPKCFVLPSAGAQLGAFAELAVHLQELSPKGLVLGWNRQNWETWNVVESKCQYPD